VKIQVVVRGQVFNVGIARNAVFRGQEVSDRLEVHGGP